MRIDVHSRHSPPEKLAKRYPDAVIVDVTSRGPEPWVRFSPFYPHGDIPVPFSAGQTAASVEGIWQGLKVFERADIDLETMSNATMARLKRTTRRFGDCKGHRKGIGADELLGYTDARHLIYLPSYLWVLQHKLPAEVAELRAIAEHNPVVLLDYATNCDVDDPSRPLSHAGLVRAYLLDDWPRRA